jgi:acetyl-CoA carboxylase carboxyl transferase subunit alpha
LGFRSETNRNVKQMASQLKRALNDALRLVSDLKPKELIERRHERLASYGRFSDGKPR